MSDKFEESNVGLMKKSGRRNRRKYMDMFQKTTLYWSQNSREATTSSPLVYIKFSNSFLRTGGLRNSTSTVSSVVCGSIST